MLLLIPLISVATSPRVLCLHGGGQTADNFKNSLDGTGLAAEYELVFVQASNPGSVWLVEDGQGKGSSRDDADATSLALIQAAQPFAGIVAYSQGTAMAAAYLSSANSTAVQWMMAFSPYLPSTSPAIMQRIKANTPLKANRVYAYSGCQDGVISPALSRDFAAAFSDAVLDLDADGEHLVTHGAVERGLQYIETGTEPAVLAECPGTSGTSTTWWPWAAAGAVVLALLLGFM